MPLDEQWETAWALVNRSFRSSLHYAFASVNADGTPHVTPIGSLILREDEPTGFYFELFTKQLPHNLDQQPRVCILAVNSSKWFWLRGVVPWSFSLSASGAVTRDGRRTASGDASRNRPVAQTDRMDTLAEGKPAALGQLALCA